MTASTRFLAALAALLAAAGAAAAAEATTNAPSERCLVRITVTAQEFDASLPWQKRAPYVRQGYGIVVAPGRILAPESLVRNHALVEAQAIRSGERVPVSVELADDQVDLALLRIRPADAAALVPVAVSGETDVTGGVEVLQFDETLELQRGSAQVLHKAMTALPAAPYPALMYTLLTDVNVNGSGAPAFRNGQLAGVLLAYDRGSRTGSMLPAAAVRRFLDAAAQPPYEGFAYAGFTWQPLIDPALRRYLGVPAENGGIMVLACMPGSGAFGTLTNSDVILAWDGQAVDQLGFCQTPDLGRVAVSYLIQGRRPGDSVPVRIVRDRKETSLTVRLTRRDEASSLIPEDIAGAQAPYLVDGGIIVRELTGRFLKSRGNDWMRNTDSRLAHLYYTRQHAPERPGERVVIVVGVLPDPINIDYQDLRDEVVTSVNGQPVHNMADVFRAVDKTGHLTRLGLQGVGVDVVLDAARIEQANARLARNYRIPALRYPPTGGIR